MNSGCQKMRERIADLVSGFLADAERQTLQEHLGECCGCREYAEALEKEDRLLSGLFGSFDSSVTARQDAVIDAINRLNASGRIGVFEACRAIVYSSLARHAAAAAIIVVVALYFVITLSWISQINECIELCL
ncbi:MAG TPA: hypothetical protein VMW16_07040 [Sedimentisphaerales bacterium]|nr:hypothetical protein [Sedimentisphaerales bacterium]